MPKFSKGFGRRKSTVNALEDLENIPAAEPSFKVFERPNGGRRSFDGGKPSKPSSKGRPITSPKHKDENIFADIKGNRGSGASNTNTISTTDNSSRLSATSTAPSSTHDTQSSDEWKSPHDRPFHDIPLPPIPKSSSGFSLKNAGRTLSWGRAKPPTPAPSKLPHEHSPEASSSMDEIRGGRARAVTASSYASTATPPRLDETDLGLNLGGDFGADMFAGFSKRKSAIILDAEADRGMSASPEYFTPGPTPPAHSYASGRTNQPSPLNIDKNRDVEPSPYSWSSQHSHDGLLHNPSPPPVPQHGSRSTDTLPSATARPQRPGGVVDGGLRRSSAFSARRQSTLEYGDAVDEDAKLLRDSVYASRQLVDSPNKVRDSWAQPSTNPPPGTNSSWGAGSPRATPRAKKVEPAVHHESVFEQVPIDPHIAAAANVALQFSENTISPPSQNTPYMKVMTPQQFERARQDQERLRSVGGGMKDDDDEEEINYEEEEDEMEKNRQVAKQRRKQEAHMAVYRQQMMKVTGETQSPRPLSFATQSAPNLLAMGKPEEGEEEDEEVPLAILAAHGFPNKGKPPNPQLSSMGSNPNLRAAAQSVGNTSLPVFARHLPQDPYLGAGLVHPSNRESLAFSNASVHGAPARNAPPGGLVGVIASEERSRAARRGSPNAQGEYAPLPPNTMGPMPQMQRNSSSGMLMNGMPMGGMPMNGMPMNGMPMNGMPMNGMPMNGMPMNGMPMGPMGPMMLTPGDQAQIQMTQQMQQFMQMQMQFMQMMANNQNVQQNNDNNSIPQVQLPPRPGSSHVQGGSPSLRPGSAHQRTMSMLDPGLGSSWMQGAGAPLFAPSIRGQGQGYAPSIAPSERSNVGLPGRYRPVSQMPISNDKSARASTMSGAFLQNWENGAPSSTLKVVQKTEDVSDEDDEVAWAEMKKKREKKRSLWKTKKDDATHGFKEILNYGH